LLGAATCGTGELLKQTDQLSHRDRAEECDRPVQETVVVKMTNDNGSVAPVELNKQGNVYIGPKGEVYQQLPTEEQLRPLYGLK